MKIYTILVFNKDGEFMVQLIIVIFGFGTMGILYFVFCKEASKQILRSMPYSQNPDKEGGDELDVQEGCKTYYAEVGCFNMDNKESEIKTTMLSQRKEKSMR